VLKSSLEAQVDLVIPDMTEGNQSELLNVLEEHCEYPSPVSLTFPSLNYHQLKI